MNSKTTIILFFLLFLSVNSSAEQVNESYTECKDGRVVTERDMKPECNLLSIPAREIDDKYIFAASYFNNTMNIILRENLVSEFAYQDVPFYIYKSFMNSDSKESYWENCINEIYDYEIVY